MKTFDSIKNCFTVLGFDSHQSTRKDLLKFKNIISLLLIFIDMILTSVYVYYEASNFEEYVDSIYLLSSMILAFSVFSILIWQIPNHFIFINHLESIITKSKLKHGKIKKFTIIKSNTLHTQKNLINKITFMI